MPTLEHTFNGGITGNTLIANPGSSGNAFDAVDIDAGGILATYTATALHGAKALLITVPGGTSSDLAYGAWSTSLTATSISAAVYCRIYFNFASRPVETALLRGMSATTQAWRVSVQATGEVIIKNAANTILATSTMTLSTGTTYRIESSVATSGGNATIRIYVGESATISETLSVTGQSFGTSINSVRFGLPSTVSPGTDLVFTVDSVGVSDSTWLGPLAPWRVANTFDGGTVGSNIITNQAGSGTNFDVVTISGSGNFKYNATNPVHATTGARCLVSAGLTASGFVAWLGTLWPGPTQLTKIYTRFYVRYASRPVASYLQLVMTAAHAQRWGITVTAAGLVELRNSPNTVVATSSTALDVGSVYRIEAGIAAPLSTTGAGDVKIFLGDAVIPLETLTVSAQNFSQGVSQVRFGQCVNATPGASDLDFLIDDVAIDRQNWIGPSYTGRASELDAARPAAKPVGRALESDTARPLETGPTVVLVGQATEADTAAAATARKSLAVAQATETDTLTVATVRKILAVAQAAETDTVQPVTAAKTVNAAQAAETDAAQPAAASKTLTVAQAAETGTVGPAAAVKTVPVGQAEEVDTLLVPAAVKTLSTGQASETDTAAPASTPGILGRAVETDTVAPAAVVKTLNTGQATETDTVAPVTVVRTITVGAAGETGTAGPVTGAKNQTTGQANETDSVFAVTPLKTLLVQAATEADTVFAAAVAAGVVGVGGTQFSADTSALLSGSDQVNAKMVGG